MPADVLPPRQVPSVPTLQPAAPQPEPAYNPSEAQPIPLQPKPLAARPVQATAMPSSSATYAPTPGTHLPDDIAKRITETPIQNSTDVNKEIQHGTSGTRLKSLVSFLIFTAAIFVAAFLINQFIFQSYYVEGTSMTPSLQNNDRLIISKVERTLAAIQGKPYIPERGQIVVLDSSIVGLNGQKEQLIKRVIGLPGDHVHIDKGVVTITNSQHPDGYDVTQSLGLTNLQPAYTDAPVDITVPNAQVYVMGDNREQGGSYDSRAFGPIDGDKIQGRLWARILPFDHAQLF
jgi:signal peptidase I